MGSRFKKTVIAENVRKSLSGWQRRVKAKHVTSHTTPLPSSAPTTPSDSVAYEGSSEGSSYIAHGTTTIPHRNASEIEARTSFEIVSLDSEICHRSVDSSDHITSD